MNYEISEVLDLENFEKLMENYYNITKIPYGLLDSKGNVLSRIGWQNICTNFHREHAISAQVCKKSDMLAFKNCKSGEYYTHICGNGLIDSFIPISIEGEIIAYLTLGHFLFEEPNINKFINQGKAYNYDIPSYLESLKKLPIIPEHEFNKHMDFYLSLVKMLESHGEKFIQNKKSEKLLLEEKNIKIKNLNNEVIKKDNLLKEAREYDELRTEFFSNLSHELKTPINLIYSALQVSEPIFDQIQTGQTMQTEKLQKYRDIIKQNCFRLIRLTDNILDITKFDSGFLTLDLEYCNIVEVIEHITLSIIDYIENTGINVVFDTDVEEKYIVCDPLKMERVILNLLSNAVKFTEKGGQINVTICDKIDNVSISIKDTGKGIPLEKQESIFGRFIQIDKSLSRSSEGSGIGLSLVKAIIELHNGSISLNSEIGKGSEFIITLPSNQKDVPINNHIYSHNENSSIKRTCIEFSDIYI